MRKLKVAQDRKIASKTIEKGLIIVHTGTGKGKTSAALGMVVRAIGHGMKVGVIQLVKGAMQTGEKAVFDRFPDLVEFKPMGEGFTWDTQDRSRDIAVARAAWEEVKRMIADPSYRMVVADELNIVLRYDYLPVDEVLAVLADKGLTAEDQTFHLHPSAKHFEADWGARIGDAVQETAAARARRLAASH